MRLTASSKLDALRFGLVFGQAHPGHFGVAKAVAYRNTKNVLYKVH
jgi:hypothetical protein